MDSQSYIDGAFDAAGDNSGTDATTGASFGNGNGSMGGSGGGAGSMFGDVMNFLGSALAEDSKTQTEEYNWSLMDQNAQLAAAASADALRRGNIQAGMLRVQGTQAASNVTASYAASGVDETQGTAAGMSAYTAGVGEYQAQQAANNAARQAFGYKTQETRFQNQKTQAMAAWGQEQQTYTLNQIGTMAKFGLDAASMGGG